MGVMSRYSLSFTCYQYAFDLIDVAEVDMIALTYPKIFPNSEFTSCLVTELMHEITIKNANDGDIVVYFKNDIPVHAGKMKNKQVVSKWGIAHLWQHGVYEVPIEYGDSVRFYNNPGKQAFIIAFQKWASSKIKNTSPVFDKAPLHAIQI